MALMALMTALCGETAARSFSFCLNPREAGVASAARTLDFPCVVFAAPLPVLSGDNPPRETTDPFLFYFFQEFFPLPSWNHV